MTALRDIWVIMPAYNEADVIGAVIGNLRKYGYEHILIVDDGSSDQTAEQAVAAGAEVIRHLVNRGPGAATHTGLELARRRRWPVVVLMDADGQHHPEDIPVLKDKLEEGPYDLVIGSRFQHPDNEIPGSRRFFNRIGNLITNMMCRGRYSDSQSGLRILNRRAIDELEFHIDGFGYCSEMIYQAEKAGLRVGEVPTRVLYSAYSMRKGQDFEVGITTAISFIWKILFR